MSNSKGSLRSTLAVSLTNYLDAGAIVAGASGLTLWQNYFFSLLWYNYCYDTIVRNICYANLITIM